MFCLSFHHDAGYCAENKIGPNRLLALCFWKGMGSLYGADKQDNRRAAFLFFIFYVKKARLFPCESLKEWLIRMLELFFVFFANIRSSELLVMIRFLREELNVKGPYQSDQGVAGIELRLKKHPKSSSEMIFVIFESNENLDMARILLGRQSRVLRNLKCRIKMNEIQVSRRFHLITSVLYDFRNGKVRRFNFLWTRLL